MNSQNFNIIDLLVVLQNSSSLLDKESLKNEIRKLNTQQIKLTGNLMFGTGVSSKTDLSAGMPFEILSFFLLAKVIQDKFPEIAIYNILPDAHAQQNNFPTDEIKKVADAYEIKLNAIANFLKISNFHVLRSSEYSNDENYNEILTSLESIENMYIRRQIADLKYLSTYYNVDKKIGWRSKTRTEYSKDEPFFDLRYLHEYPESQILFLYLESGKRLSNAGMDVIPYTINPNDIGCRIILGQNQIVNDFLEAIKIGPAREECSMQNLKAYINYIKKILRLYSSLFPNSLEVEKQDWMKRVDTINLFFSRIEKGSKHRIFTF